MHNMPASLVILWISALEYGSTSQASSGESGVASLRSPKYIPPVSSRTMQKSTPLHTDSLSGENCTSDSAAKLHGRRFPNVPSSFRRRRSPCSGRTAPVPHSGPPTAPRRTALAALARARASVVSAVPWVLIEHCFAASLPLAYPNLEGKRGIRGGSK